MALTKDGIAALAEDELRSSVLIPLFRAMGFQDVALHHGGSGEQGKDIVMWKASELGTRLNYAVVVKATRTSGKATGKSSASEVLFQIQQCFGEEYLDKRSLSDQRVDRVYVVSSQEITKEARRSLRSTLSAGHLDRLLEFVDGDTLWDMIQKHLPREAVWDQLTRASSTLENVSEHYRVRATTGANGINLSLEPKTPTAFQDAPAEFRVVFQFPPTPEGIRFNEALQGHIKTGAPVTIPAQYVKTLDLPAFLDPIFRASPEQTAEIHLGPAKASHQLLVHMRLLTPQAESASLEYVELRDEQIGTERAVYSNSSQNVPWRVRFEFDRKTQNISVSVSMDPASHDAKSVRDGFRFLALARTGGDLSVVGARSGLPFFQTSMASSVVDFGKDHARFLQFLEELALIQEKLKVRLKLPEQGVSAAEVRLTHEIAQKLQTGRAEIDAGGSFTLTIDREGAQRALALYKNAVVQTITLTVTESHELFGNNLQLGETELAAETRLDAASETDVEQQLDATPPNDWITMRPQVVPGTVVKASYKRWLRGEG